MPEDSLQRVKEQITELKEEFGFYQSKRELLEALIEYGKELKEPEKLLLKDENKVFGCISGVYISVKKDNDGKLHFQGHSDSLIVKGFVRILFKCLDGLSVQNMLKAEKPIMDFVKEVKLSESMVSSRANAFGNILSFIKKKSVLLS